MLSRFRDQPDFHIEDREEQQQQQQQQHPQSTSHPNYAQVVEYGSSDPDSISAQRTPDLSDTEKDDRDIGLHPISNCSTTDHNNGSKSTNHDDDDDDDDADDDNAVTKSGGGSRKFDAVILIDRAVKTGYEDDLERFIRNPDLFWKPIANIDAKYLEWSLEAARRGHLAIVQVLWGLFEMRHDERDNMYRDDQLKKIVYGASMHGKLDVLNWVWKNSRMDRYTHSRPDAFKVGPEAAVEGGSLAALQWFCDRGILMSVEHINVAIEHGYADIVRWYFKSSVRRKSDWITRYKIWYRHKLDNHEIDRSVQKAMIFNSVFVPRLNTGHHMDNTLRNRPDNMPRLSFRRVESRNGGGGGARIQPVHSTMS